MGTYYQASLEIGGTVSKRRLASLWKLLKGTGISQDWSDEFESLEHLRRFADDRDNTLMLTCNEASLETYEKVKDWCIRGGNSYYLREDAVAEGGENVEWWSPGMKEPMSCWGHEGRAVVLIEDLQKCKKMRDYVDFVRKYTPPDMLPFVVE